MNRHHIRYLIIFLLLIIGSGCFQPAVTGKSMTAETVKEVEAEKPSSYLHQVQRQGENLILIATWYTGSGNNWKAIARANPNLEPRRIQIGEHITIPAELLRTRQTMPGDFHLAKTPAKPEKTEAAPPLETSEPPELFGPVDSASQGSAQEEETKLILETLDE